MENSEALSTSPYINQSCLNLDSCNWKVQNELSLTLYKIDIDIVDFDEKDRDT